jgi:hypothetical protein
MRTELLRMRAVSPPPGRTPAPGPRPTPQVDQSRAEPAVDRAPGPYDFEDDPVHRLTNKRELYPCISYTVPSGGARNIFV